MAERSQIASRPALDRLVRAGYLTRVDRGIYAIAERPSPQAPHPFVLATARLDEEPCYISWWSALVHHDLTEQMPLVVYVAVTRPHRPRHIGGTEVRYVVQGRDRFYGYRPVSLPSGKVRVASAEKAVLDSLDRPELAGGLREVVKALASPWGLDRDHLVRMALRHPSDALVGRLGYLMTVLGVGDPRPLLVRRRRGGALIPLDVSAPEDARSVVDPTWRVADTIDPERLISWTTR